MAPNEPERPSSHRHRRSHHRHSSVDDVRLYEPLPTADELRQMRSDYYAVSAEERRRQNEILSHQRRKEKAAKEEEHVERRRHRKHSSTPQSSFRPPRQAGDQDENGYTFVYGERLHEPREHRRRSSTVEAPDNTRSRRSHSRHDAARSTSALERPPPRRSHSTSARSHVRLKETFLGDVKKESKREGKKPAAASSSSRHASGPSAFDELFGRMFQREKPARSKSTLKEKSTQEENPTKKEKSTQEEKSTKKEKSTQKEKEKERPLLNGVCVVCQSECSYTKKRSPRSEGVKLACECVWCNDCLKHVFRRSLEDRTLMPPRCCPAYGEIRRKLVWHLFWPDDIRFVKKWVKRYEQWKTDKGVTCPVKGCSNYITQRRIEAQGAGSRKPLVCSKCSTKICMKCRNIAHGDKSCPKPIDDPDEYAFDALAANEHWQQCPSCKIRVSKEEGCNHMTCVCGRDFCFLCGRKWHKDGCVCPYYTAQDLPPPMDLEAVRRFAQELDAEELEAFFFQFQRQFLYQF